MPYINDLTRSNCFTPVPVAKLMKRIVPQARIAAAFFPVWKDSIDKPIKFTPLPKKKATRLYHEARRFERQTRQPGKQDGRLGRNGLKVLEALIFDFLNYATGELLPSIKSIATKAGISPASVYRGLDKLRAAGVVQWQRRKDSVLALGRVLWFQKSSAYHISQPDNWRGYAPPSMPPAPHPTSWGATPALPRGLERAVEMVQRREANAPTLFEALTEDPGDSLAMALARLGQAIGYKGQH